MGWSLVLCALADDGIRLWSSTIVEAGGERERERGGGGGVIMLLAREKKQKKNFIFVLANSVSIHNRDDTIRCMAVTCVTFNGITPMDQG